MISPIQIRPYSPAVRQSFEGAERPITLQFEGKKSGNKAEDTMGRAFAAIFFGVIGLLGIASAGAVKYADYRLSVGKTYGTVQTALDKFHSTQDLPNRGQEQFLKTLGEVQTALPPYSSAKDTQIIADVIPTLTDADQATVAQLMEKAKSAKTPGALRPLFMEWLTLLEKHTEQPIDKEAVAKDATYFFNRVDRYHTFQDILWYAMLASAASVGFAIYIGGKKP